MAAPRTDSHGLLDRHEAANLAKPAPAGPKAKRPPGDRASPRGIAAKDPREEQKGIAQNWQNQSCVDKHPTDLGNNAKVHQIALGPCFIH